MTRGLLVVTAVLCLTPAVARGQGTDKIDGGARVTAVDGKKVTIDRGSKAGLKLGDTGNLLPIRPREISSEPVVDANVRIAVGKVTEITDDSATLTIDSIAGSVTTGTFFAFDLTLPREVTRWPLTRVLAHGIDLVSQIKAQRFVALDALLGDRSGAVSDKALDAMIGDIRAIRSLAVDAYDEKPTAGPYRGKSTGAIIDALDRTQMIAFMEYVDAFALTYIGKQWKVPDMFFAWVFMGAPSGEDHRKTWAAMPQLLQARAAIAAGKLEDARAIYATTLKDWQDLGEARQALERIDRATSLKRAVTTDPDDTASEYELVEELDALGADEAALAHIAPLAQRKFDELKVEREHGIILGDLKRWAQARDVLDKLAKAHPDETEVAELAKLARAQSKLAAAPTDVAAQLELAGVLLARDAFDGALETYRKVLDSKTATAKQRDAAGNGQLAISAAEQLDVLLGWADEEIGLHDVDAARRRIDPIIRLADQQADKTRGNAALDRLAESARKVFEEDFAIELMRKRIERTADIPAYTSLAFALLKLERLDEAEAAAKQALTKPGDQHYAHLILAHIARMRGKLADADKEATKAATDKTYAWPRIVLARVAAAKGDWEEAHTLAVKSVELSGSERKAGFWETRATVTATARGLQADEALRADPKSARERLRLVRALADLGLVAAAKDAITKLPKDGTWRSDAWWAIASSGDAQIPLAERVAAAHEAKPTTPLRKRVVAEIEGQAQLLAKPTDDAVRIALAKQYMLDEKLHLAVATLRPLLVKQPIPQAALAIAQDAFTALPLAAQMQVEWEAFGRNEQDAVIRATLEIQQTYDKVGIPNGRMYARELRGEALGMLGRYDEAIKVVDEARAIAAADGDESRMADNERRIAKYRAALGTNDELGAVLERTRKLCTDIDNESCLHFVHSQLSMFEQEEGHLAAAIDHARLAWNLADRLGQADLGRSARLQLAIVLMNANRVADAEQVAIKLQADARVAGDTTYEQGATLILGAVAVLRGDSKNAHARFQEVYDLGTRRGMTAFRAIARRFEGAAWLETDHLPAKAVIAFEQSAELYSAETPTGAAIGEYGIVLRRLAEARLDTGDIAGARTAAEQGFAVAQKFGKRNALATANWVLSLVALAEQKPDEAVTRAKQAVALAEQTDAVILLWNDYYALGRAYELKKQDKEALAAYEAALRYLGNALLAAGNDTERSGYMNTGRVRDVYRHAIDLMLRLNMNTRAREVLELSRDAMLKQSLDATSIATQDATVKALLDKYNSARDRVNGLQKQLEGADKKRAAELKTLVERLAKAREELNQAAGELKVQDRQLFQALTMAPQEIAARASSLPAGSVVVEYFLAADALSIFVHAPNRKEPVVVRVKVGAAELAQRIDDYRDAVIAENAAVKQRAKVENLGRTLAGWLLEPIRSYLKDAKTIVIVPFGPLAYVPFDALVVSADGKPVRYAIEDYRIVMQTPWTLETLMKPARARSTGRMLAIANPDGTLPGAQREVNRIMKTALPDAQVLGKTGTVKRVKELAGTSRYLHIATHGVLDSDPRKSYLKMSDGPLTVQDITSLQGLRTNNDLVVLSACDTATDVRDSAGEDLVSLASSFALAGAPTVVASLWEVSDDSTAELMATFYRALEKNKDGDRIDALRTAKLDLLRLEKDHARPFAAPWHWASFQLYGDFRAPGAKKSP